MSNAGVASGLPNYPSVNPNDGLTTFQRVAGFSPQNDMSDLDPRQVAERPLTIQEYLATKGEYVAPIAQDPISRRFNRPTAGSMVFHSGLQRMVPWELVRDFYNSNPGAQYNNGGAVEPIEKASGPVPLGLGAVEPAASPMPQQGSSQDDLVTATIMAMDPNSGMSQNDRNFIIQAFVEMFGEEALIGLMEQVKGDSMTHAFSNGGPVSDGMSDSIPAMIDGQQPAALSEGEFVVPADVVSGLGNGDTDSGVKRLMDMVNTIRIMKTGAPVQPPAVNPAAVMP